MLLFDYLGAFYIWIYLIALSVAKGKTKPSFSDVMSPKGRREGDSFIDLYAYGLKLKLIGAVVTGVIIKILAEIIDAFTYHTFTVVSPPQSLIPLESLKS